MPTPEGSCFLIYDTAKKKDVWVGLNESGHDFVVKSADPSTDSVTVEYQGRSMHLALRPPKVASAGSVAAAGGPPGTPSAVSSTVVLNPTPADEQRRLDAVAQEVRRRRLERERAATNVPGGPAVGGAPPAAPNR
jgi:hypothetical protein